MHHVVEDCFLYICALGAAVFDFNGAVVRGECLIKMYGDVMATFVTVEK